MTVYPLALARRVGRRGAALLFFALLDAIYAISLADPPAEAKQSVTLAFVRGLAPLACWSTLWGAAGIVCAVGAFAQRDRWAFTVAIFVKVLWGTVFLVGWALFGLERGYVIAALWLAMAAWIYIISTWPEPPTAAPLTNARGDGVS